MLTIEDRTININEEFMADNSAEYVTISEMWFRYNDNMDNYKDTIPAFCVCAFDNSIFIATVFKRGGGAWHFQYKYSIPACLFKYDVENDAVLYCGYLIRDGMIGEFQIEKVEQQ